MWSQAAHPVPLICQEIARPPRFRTRRHPAVSEQVQHAVQIDRLAHLELMLRSGQIVQEEFQNERAAESAALELEVGEARRQKRVPDRIDPDKAGVLHRTGEAVALAAARCGAHMLRAVLTKILAADGLIAAPAVGAAEEAAFVAQKLRLRLQLRGQCVQLAKRAVQPEIGHDVREFAALQLPAEIRKACQHLCCRGDEIQAGITLQQIIKQQFGMDDDAALRPRRLEQGTEFIAPPVGKVFPAQERVAEGQPCGDAVCLRERQHLARVPRAGGRAAAAPDASCRCPVDRADVAPGIKPVAVIAP